MSHPDCGSLEFRKMTVLVTGGAGYIGSHVVHELAEKNCSVIVLDNLSSGFRDAIPSDVPFFAGDAGDENFASTLIARHHVDAVMHFAASSVVPESFADPVAYYRNNTINSLALIDAAIRSGIKHIVFSSTAAIYGDPDTQLVREDAAARPISDRKSTRL